MPFITNVTVLEAATWVKFQISVNDKISIKPKWWEMVGYEEIFT